MEVKAAAREHFDSAHVELIKLSHRIHAHPELGFEEEQASSWLCESLADAGFAVERGICDLPTAFHARAGSGPLHVGICAEYDSLPGIGHACGHNIIAASAVGAALAAAKVADEVGLTLHVIGRRGGQCWRKGFAAGAWRVRGYSRCHDGAPCAV